VVVSSLLSCSWMCFDQVYLSSYFSGERFMSDFRSPALALSACRKSFGTKQCCTMSRLTYVQESALSFLGRSEPVERNFEAHVFAY